MDIPVLSSFPFADGKMTLRYLTYNVSGLLSKLDNATFVNYITSFDFVCLTETYIASDFDSDLFRDLGIFVAKAKKTFKPRKAVRGRVGTG